MPLSRPPGRAQCNFGEAVVVIGGVERKAHCFVLDLPHSDGCFIKAYPAETTGAFLDGHVSAFTFLGGVPRSILYDNTRLAVDKILGGGKGQRTRAFNSGQTSRIFTFTATADDADDDGESVAIAFGTMPGGVVKGATTPSTVVNITGVDVPAAGSSSPTITAARRCSWGSGHYRTGSTQVPLIQRPWS